jgi:multiple sugar transport system substrate-binding protein
MKLFKIALLIGAMGAPFLAPSAFAEPVAINFWITGDASSPERRAAAAEVALFEKAHPDIKIVTQAIAFDALHDKLITAIAGGDAPDLSWGLLEWLGELNRMHALPDLTADFANWPDREKIYPHVWETLTIDGKLVALPNYLGLRGLLYHEDMLKKAGVAPPTTWKELIDASLKIKQATGKFGFGVASNSVRSPQELIMYLAAADVQIAKRQPDGKYRNDWADDHEEMQRAAGVFALYREFLDKGVIPPQATGWGYDEEDTNFALGQYAMVVNGSWMADRVEQNPEQMKDVRVVAPPAGLKAATYFEISPYFVFKGKHMAQTLEFASFLLSPEYQNAVYPNRSPRIDVPGDETWGKPFTALTPIGVAFPPVALGSIIRAMEESVGRVFLKNDQPAAVAQWLAKAINKSLHQSGELSEP